MHTATRNRRRLCGLQYMDGAFWGGNGSFRHLRMRLTRSVGAAVSAVQYVALLLTCCCFCFFHKYNLLCTGDTRDSGISGGRLDKVALFAFYSKEHSIFKLRRKANIFEFLAALIFRICDDELPENTVSLLLGRQLEPKAKS